MFIEGVYLSHFFVVGARSWSELEFLPCREFLPSPIGIFMHHLDLPPLQGPLSPHKMERSKTSGGRLSVRSFYPCGARTPQGRSTFFIQRSTFTMQRYNTRRARWHLLSFSISKTSNFQHLTNGISTNYTP